MAVAASPMAPHQPPPAVDGLLQQHDQQLLLQQP
jgi:hypothetical protein